MKISNKLIAFLFVLAVTAGCKKDIDPVSEVVDVTYPTIELTGPSHILIPVGGSYNDEGATLTDDISGAQSQITASTSDIDNTTPGLYQMTYEAANSNGFKTTVTRTILVLDYTPAPGLTVDLSGDWLREATGVIATWTQVATGLYIIDYVGGVTSTPAYVVQTSDSTIDIPLQLTLDGLEMEGVNEELNIAPGDTTVTYTLIAEGFGAAPRTFVKQ